MYERMITVRCPKCGRLDEAEVKFVNIEEGPQGEDILTFKCPRCKKVRKSERRG